MINPGKHIHTYAVFSEINGEKAQVEDIIAKIKSLNLGGVLSILSQITSSNGALKKECTDMFRRFNRHVGSMDILNSFGDKELYSEQGLFFLWKWLLAYGDQKSMSQPEDVSVGVNQIILLCILLSDYLDSDVTKESVSYSLFSNPTFNTFSDLGSDIARASLMFTEIASNPLLFEKKDYMDLSERFVGRYGYTLQDYFSVIVGLIMEFRTKKEISVNWMRSLNAFDSTNLSDVAKTIVHELSFNLSEGEEWATSSLNEPWNYKLFRRKPLLLSDTGTYCPVSTKLLDDAIFDQLYFKIRDAFPSDSTQVLSFYGKVFEKYIETITMEAVKKKNGLNYQIIKEFKFKAKHKGEKRSPDVLIRLGDTLFAVEAKAHRLRMDSMFGVKNTIDKDIQRMTIEPIIQLNKRLEQLSSIEHPSIEGVNQIYLLSVTWGHFPTLNPFEKKISESMPKFNLPIKGRFHLDIEEYEMLMQLISRKSSKPLSHYLDNKTKLAPNMPFKNFLIDSSLRPRRMEYLTEKLRNEVNRCRDHLYRDKTQ
ncbi:MAG: hypothetical protein ACE3L7_32685 [Candidatus Pristimantibacillus sp.]